MNVVNKTGLAQRIRALLKTKEWAISPLSICEALDIPEGPGRARLWDALKDFQKRGEIEKTQKGRFRYNHAFKRRVKGHQKATILKAVYVSVSGFSASDIQRLSDIKDKHYVQKIMRELVTNSYVQQVGRKKCVHGRGVERVFTVVDRARFRVDLLD